MRNVLTLEAFAEWAETQPAGLGYPYDNQRNCAFCQYLKFIGFPRPGVGSTQWRPEAMGNDYRPLPYGLPDALASEPHTFGSLAKRLRAAAEGSSS